MYPLPTPPNEFPTEFLSVYYSDTSLNGQHGFEPHVESKLGAHCLIDCQPQSQNVVPIPSSTNSSQQSSPSMITKSKKGYPCGYCAKIFSKPSALRSHIYTHTGEKPFVCSSPGCGRRFAVISNLRRHQNVHKRESATPRLSPQERLWRVKNLMRRVSCPGQLNLVEPVPETCLPQMSLETDPPSYFLHQQQQPLFCDTRSDVYPWSFTPSFEAYSPTAPQPYFPYGLRCQTSPEMQHPTSYFDHPLNVETNARKAGLCNGTSQNNVAPQPEWYGIPSPYL